MPLCAALVRCSCAVVHLCDAPIQCVQLLFFFSLPLSSTNTLPSAIPLCNLFLLCPSGALAQWAFAVAFCDSLNCTCAMLLCNALVRCSVILCNAYITVVLLCNNYIDLTAAKLHHTNLIAWFPPCKLCWWICIVGVACVASIVFFLSTKAVPSQIVNFWPISYCNISVFGRLLEF